MKPQWEYLKWESFFKRNVKLLGFGGAGFIFFWYGIDVMHWGYGLFGADLIGYGEDRRRGYRVLAIGFLIAYLFGTSLSLFIMLYYRKYPEKYKPQEGEEK